MKGITIALASLVLLCVGLGVCQGASSYHFEGPRQASASIEETAELFSIEASVIPVTVFDTATNDQLNRSKLRGVAMMALARHLNVPAASEVSVSELRTTGWRGDSARVVAAFEVSKSAVRVVERPPAAAVHTAEPVMQASKTIGVPVGSLLLTRKGDYLDTVAQLQEVNTAMIADMQTPGVPVEKLAGLEQAITNQFGALRSVVDADSLLLTVEREDVYAAMTAVQENLSGQLKEGRSFAMSSALAVKSMTAVTPFDMYLKADPILLQYGGARVIVLPESNKVMIVSVAFTAVKDNSGADRLRMEKVCHQKALAGLLTEKQGLKVKYALETRDSTTSVFDDGREQTASLETMLETTSAQAEGFVRDLPVVGSWCSDDGQLFFMAIGGVSQRIGKAEAQE